MGRRIVAALHNPYRGRGTWLKAAFHFHTTASDGRLSPERTAAKYASRGYRIIGISDHNRVTRITDSESRFPGLVFIPVAEVEWPHLLRIGTRARGRLPDRGFVRAIRESSRAGEFAVLCHPGWSNCSSADLAASRGVAAMEVYNHGCEIENATGLAAERWDTVLQAGRRVWGFAVDDSHFSDAYPQFDGGWIVVRVPRPDASSVLNSLRRGSFYSSSGPSLFHLTVTRGKIALRLSPVVEVRAIADGVGSGIVLFSKRPRRSWTIEYGRWGRQPESYVRIEARDARGRSLWANPLFVRK